MERPKVDLSELAVDLVAGRNFPPRTPHIYAHPIVSRLAEVIELRPEVPAIVA